MTEERTNHDVCPAGQVGLMDNIFRTWIHNPRKMFGNHVSHGMHVLDLGCGGGFTSIGMAKLVGEAGHVTSVDLQQEMLDFARKRAHKAGVSERITFHRCGRNSIGLESEYDFAVAFYMVHEVPDRMSFLSEVHSLLKPGGRFFIAEPTHHVRKDSFEKMVKMASDIGFKIIAEPKVSFSYTVVLEKS